MAWLHTHSAGIFTLNWLCESMSLRLFDDRLGRIERCCVANWIRLVGAIGVRAGWERGIDFCFGQKVSSQVRWQPIPHRSTIETMQKAFERVMLCDHITIHHSFVPYIFGIGDASKYDSRIAILCARPPPHRFTQKHGVSYRHFGSIGLGDARRACDVRQRNNHHSSVTTSIGVIAVPSRRPHHH